MKKKLGYIIRYTDEKLFDAAEHYGMFMESSEPDNTIKEAFERAELNAKSGRPNLKLSKAKVYRVTVEFTEVKSRKKGKCKCR